MAAKTKEARAAYMRLYRKRRPEYFRERDRAYHDRNRDKRLAYKRAVPADVVRFSNLKSKFGITREQYEAMLAAQGNKCAICDSPFECSRKTHVDHNHTTGAIRGILCHHCNTGIGLFRDEPGRLLLAAAYLSRRVR